MSLLAVVLGILIPRFIFTKNVIIMEIILTFILVTSSFLFVVYIHYKKYLQIEEEFNKSKCIGDIMVDLSDTILNTPDTYHLLFTILEKAVNLIDKADKGSLMILNQNNKLEYKALIGYEEDGFKKIQLDLEDTFLYQKSKGAINKPCIIENVHDFNKSTLHKDLYESLKNAKGLTIKTTLSTPLILNDTLYGMLNLDSTKENTFTKQDIKVMEFFSNQVSINIKTHKLIDKISYFSRYDDLTNSYNRRYFEELYTSLVNENIKTRKSFFLVYFDLDELKGINDNHGHLSGDKAILKFANTVQKNIRDSDLFARYGGDEFIALIYNVDRALLEKRIKGMKEQLDKEPILIDDVEVKVTFSYGIANYPEDSEDFNELINIADQRMYYYKTKGLKNGA